MHKTKSGFTIVELLIVIVVIGILAAITIVAYNGIQTRSKNAKTLTAASSWIKGLKLYNADKGAWPTEYSCLGTTSTYVGNGGQCWNSIAWTVKSSFLSTMQPYMSSFPEPDTTDVAPSQYTPHRGLMYSTDGSSYWQMYVFQVGVSVCPNIGLTLSATVPEATGVQCIYALT